MKSEELIAELEWAKQEGLGAMQSVEGDRAVGDAEQEECWREQERFEKALTEAIAWVKGYIFQDGP